MAISNILSAWLRCNEHAAIPFAPMGIKGAAIATLISQLFNLVCIGIGFMVCIQKDEDKPVLAFHFEKISLRDYFIMIMPILVSEFLWSLGQNVESAVYGHLGTLNLAAYTLTCPIQGLIVGALSGLSAAAARLEHSVEETKNSAKRYYI